MKIILKTFCFLMIAVVLMSMALGDGNKNDIRNDTDSFTQEEIQERIDAVPPTNPELLDQLRQQNGILAVYGEIPQKKQGIESYEWWLNISSIVDSISEDDALRKYMSDNSNFIMGYGAIADGYVSILIHEEFRNDVTQKDLENMKNIVDQYAAQEGVENVPIVISIGTPIIFTVAESPRFYPETDRSAFKHLTNSDRVLKTSGEVPRKSEGADAQSWNEALEKIVSDLQSDPEFEKYLSQNGGPIGMFFVDYDYISVILSDDSELTNKQLDAIIQAVTAAGEQNGIQNIPVAVSGKAENIKRESVPGFEFLTAIGVFAALCLFISSRKKQ
ncbi:hypothetical protein MsAg5_03450 [Methanosarcinaceae archaeon Ag5]|uniref:Uncharacterized protein n=1 Tax=Methanolapillus africanus TaxID=3028297 RepID=A0AAE4MH42_9EURY|nr:hypothetical protein [Methanosarcinaceae archaeon Ag5]